MQLFPSSIPQQKLIRQTMLDQDILNPIIGDPDGRAIGERYIQNLESDIKHTRFMFENTVKTICETLKNNPGEAEKQKAKILQRMEQEIAEIEGEIQQIRDAIAKRNN